jgi:hypothetical protein
MKMAYVGLINWDDAEWSACEVALCTRGSSGISPDCGACDVFGYGGTSF